MGRTAKSAVDKALDAYAELTADERTIFAMVLARTQPIGAQQITKPPAKRGRKPKPQPEAPNA